VANFRRHFFNNFVCIYVDFVFVNGSIWRVYTIIFIINLHFAFSAYSFFVYDVCLSLRLNIVFI